MQQPEVASIVMAAGRGSRMKGYRGNKTLLPLKPGPSIYEGSLPILTYILNNLPPGPKAVIVHHCEADVIAGTSHLGVTFCRQPQLNGTGGAILAAEDFIAAQECESIIITMGDVPFVKKETYLSMVRLLQRYDMVVLGFCPQDKKQYGVLEVESDQVVRITEWKYWRNYPPAKQRQLKVCNSGIYALGRRILLNYLPVMAARPQEVSKEINGRMETIEEFFITDLVEYLTGDGLKVGFVVAEDELETMGVDDREALQLAQRIYRQT